MEQIMGEQIKNLWDEFIKNYNLDKQISIWNKQKQIFRKFWNEKIMTAKDHDVFSESDYDAIIKMIDVKARGFDSSKDVAVAHIGLPQGTWYRRFNDLVDQSELKKIMNNIFQSEGKNDDALIEMLNKLEKENEKNKNGLTGKSANALNALLFINTPDAFLSSISLKHRFRFLKYFGFGDPSTYQTYGEKIVKSNRDIINGFKNFGVDSHTRAISDFIYSEELERFWKKDESPDEYVEIVEGEEREIKVGESEFVLEKHLEDFLIANWENTELGKKYELIEEGEDLVSQQYKTGIGIIDLLVKEKETGNYVVIELKKGQTGDDTVGQLTRYMAWIRKNKANNKKVKGMIISRGIDEKLRYSVSEIPDAEILTYRINFELRDIDDIWNDKS